MQSPPPLPAVEQKSYWKPAAACLLGLAAVFCIMLGSRAYVIPTGSMEDTLQVGDRILVERITPWLKRSPQRGELIVFRHPLDPTQTHVKRVVGIPGDHIRLRDKQLYRNGAAVRESYVCHKTDFADQYRDNFPAECDNPFCGTMKDTLEKNVRNGELVVPAGKYFVLGDNRDSSLDSRYFGFISAPDIVGRPILIYFRAKWFKRDQNSRETEQ